MELAHSVLLVVLVLGRAADDVVALVELLGHVLVAQVVEGVDIDELPQVTASLHPH